MICTKQGSIIKAYQALERMSTGVLPLHIAYKLFKIKQALRPHFEFQQEQEMALIDQYNPDIQDGVWVFNNESDKNEFVEKLEEISKMHVDVDIMPESIPLDSALEGTVEDMESLCGFVLFEE